jgi:hypothetical protein
MEKPLENKAYGVDRQGTSTPSSLIVPTKIKTEQELNNFIREKMNEILSQVQWADAVFLYSTRYEHGGNAHIEIMPLKNSKYAPNQWYYGNWKTYKFEFKHDFTYGSLITPIKLITRDGKVFLSGKIEKKLNLYSGYTTVWSDEK